MWIAWCRTSLQSCPSPATQTYFDWVAGCSAQSSCCRWDITAVLKSVVALNNTSRLPSLLSQSATRDGSRSPGFSATTTRCMSHNCSEAKACVYSKMDRMEGAADGSAISVCELCARCQRPWHVQMPTWSSTRVARAQASPGPTCSPLGLSTPCVATSKAIWPRSGSNVRTVYPVSYTHLTLPTKA